MNRMGILFAEHLKTVFSSLGAKTREVVLVVGMGDVLLRTAELPPVDEVQARQMLKMNGRNECLAWNWVQANGHPRDMVCRGLLLGMHRAGLIELPAKRMSPPNPLGRRAQPPPLSDRSWDRIECLLSGLGPVEIRQVRRTPEEKLFGRLMQAHHYLGYTQPMGEHLKYVYYAGATPIACMAWSSSPRHLGARDRFIGWSAPQRRANIHLLAYNTRFLILPWVKVRHLASHLLARTAGVISAGWQKLYHHPIHLLETFIDPERFKGTCYRAANWILVGMTTGRGKDDQTKRANRSLKELLVYPLSRYFRRELSR